MIIHLYAFSAEGTKLCEKITKGLTAKLWETEAYVSPRFANISNFVKARDGGLRDCVGKSFEISDCIIFVGAAGIAVRSVAPFVKSKRTDPAVICMDDKGINVISLLSGHIGKANRLTKLIADMIGGNPVITTATDVNSKFSVDEWAETHNLYIANFDILREIAARILEGKKVGFVSDFPTDRQLPPELCDDLFDIGICVSLDENKKPFANTLNLVPQIVSVGVGCRKNADFEDVYDAVTHVLAKSNISVHSVKCINSIDLKKDEQAVIETARVLEVPFYTYSAEELTQISGQFSKSDFVMSVTKLDTVCERAAVKGSNKGKLTVTKTIKNSVTAAVCVDEYSVNFNEV